MERCFCVSRSLVVEEVPCENRGTRSDIADCARNVVRAMGCPEAAALLPNDEIRIIIVKLAIRRNSNHASH